MHKCLGMLCVREERSPFAGNVFFNSLLSPCRNAGGLGSGYFRRNNAVNDVKGYWALAEG